MSDLSAKISERMRSLSDEELRAILKDRSGDYSDEAMATARVELEARGRAAGPQRKEPTEEPTAAATAPPAAAPAAAVDGKPRGRVAGIVFLVIATVLIYASVLVISILAVAPGMGYRPIPDLKYYVIIYLIVAALCIRAGARRRRGWSKFLGTAILVTGCLALLASLGLARQSQSVAHKAMLTTAVVLLVSGAATFLLRLAFRGGAESGR